MRNGLVLTMVALSISGSVAAQTVPGVGAPGEQLGYRTDLGTWHALRLDGADNLDVNCVTGCGGSSGGAAGDVASFAAGGAAQTMFGGTTPVTGFALYNPNANDDCWASDSTTAAQNGAGSIRLIANGGGYETPASYRPVGPISLWCPSTGDKITARRW